MIKFIQVGPAIILLFLMLGVLIAVVGRDVYMTAMEEEGVLIVFDRSRERAQSSTRMLTRGLVFNPVLRVSRPPRSIFAPTPTPNIYNIHTDSKKFIKHFL